MASRSLSPAGRYAVVPAAAAGLVILRWAWQGTENVWSKLSYSVYVADADLGWRRTEETYTWLGLDIVLVLALTAIGTYGTLRLLEGRLRSAKRWLGPGTRGIALASLVIPLLAFADGAPPTGARESLPVQALQSPERGIVASLPDLPSGRYAVVEHSQSAVVAKLTAGGETFDARFAGSLQGYWEASPGDFSKPMSASISVRSDSIDTGIDLRDKHALEDLKPEDHAQIRFELGRVKSTEEHDDGIAFAAGGSLTLGGRVHDVEVIGTLRPIDSGMAQRLSLGEGAHILMQATFSLNLKDTIIGNDGTFDVDEVPISVTLILKHSETTS